MVHQSNKQKIGYIILSLTIGVFIATLKFYGYKLTHANALLSDALESFVNVVAAFFAFLSLIYASRPSDANHPYGHGKMEFFASGFEGCLILLAAFAMMYKSIINQNNVVTQLDAGIAIVVITGFANGALGYFLKSKGKQLRSPTLKADGLHLISDAITSVALLAGLAAIYITKWYWIDLVITLLFSVYIGLMGIKLIRKAMAGLLDETDTETIATVVDALNKNRTAQWIDVHNLRAVQYGDALHIDTHLTLPYYLSLQQAHDAVKHFETSINQSLQVKVECFVHTDPCLPSSCSICTVDCKVRQKPFQKKIEWLPANVMHNAKHV
ncbi:MAG: cation transporter [Bacteroidia bacterium]|nr:cation transporter [Bacteroidia bacterium]HQV00264.1 cation diffusion facilitator family transporter [Bacteroidia bacterium]